MLDPLERADGPAVLLADLRVLHGGVQGGRGSPDLFCGKEYGGGGEGARQGRPGRALGAEEAGGGVRELDPGLFAGLVEGGEGVRVRPGVRAVSTARRLMPEGVRAATRSRSARCPSGT